jgi:hypothetical protein
MGRVAVVAHPCAVIPVRQDQFFENVRPCMLLEKDAFSTLNNTKLKRIAGKSFVVVSALVITVAHKIVIPLLGRLPAIPTVRFIKPRVGMFGQRHQCTIRSENQRTGYSHDSKIHHRPSHCFQPPWYAHLHLTTNLPSNHQGEENLFATIIPNPSYFSYFKRF